MLNVVIIECELKLRFFLNLVIFVILLFFDFCDNYFENGFEIFKVLWFYVLILFDYLLIEGVKERKFFFERILNNI